MAVLNRQVKKIYVNCQFLAQNTDFVPPPQAKKNLKKKACRFEVVYV